MPSVPGGPCRSELCCCQKFRESATPGRCGVCQHHLAFHVARVATSVSCKHIKYRVGSDQQVVYSAAGDPVVQYKCGCGSFVKSEQGDYNCLACSHDENMHSSEVPSISREATPQAQEAAVPAAAPPPTVPNVSGGSVAVTMAVGSGGGEAEVGGARLLVRGQHVHSSPTTTRKLNRPEPIRREWDLKVRGMIELHYVPCPCNFMFCHA